MQRIDSLRYWTVTFKTHNICNIRSNSFFFTEQVHRTSDTFTFTENYIFGWLFYGTDSETNDIQMLRKLQSIKQKALAMVKYRSQGATIVRRHAFTYQ